MEQLIENSQAETGEILDCRVRSFGAFAAVYTLSEGGGSFGIGVVLIDPSGGIEDSIFIPDLTQTEEEARTMLGALFSGGVTPCTVADVLEDMIGV